MKKFIAYMCEVKSSLKFMSCKLQYINTKAAAQTHNICLMIKN